MIKLRRFGLGFVAASLVGFTLIEVFDVVADLYPSALATPTLVDQFLILLAAIVMLAPLVGGFLAGWRLSGPGVIGAAFGAPVGTTVATAVADGTAKALDSGAAEMAEGAMFGLLFGIFFGPWMIFISGAFGAFVTSRRRGSPPSIG
jgi:hypothetical protein